MAVVFGRKLREAIVRDSVSLLPVAGTGTGRCWRLSVIRAWQPNRVRSKVGPLCRSRLELQLEKAGWCNRSVREGGEGGQGVRNF